MRRQRLTARLDGLLALGIRQGTWTAIQIGYAKSLLTHSPALAGTAEALYGERLSEREVEVLALVAEGLSNAEIAARLVLSTGTVRAHTASIYRKLDVNSRTQAAARARELGILPESP